MVVLYLIENEHFLYGNRAFREFLGRNYRELQKSGWDYWFAQIDQAEVSTIKERIFRFLTNPDPDEPMILKYHLDDCRGRRICVEHEILIHKIRDYSLAINYFFDVSEKERIEHCFRSKSGNGGKGGRKTLKYTISAREKEVLRLISEGYSSKQIASRLYISNHTAISHRKNLIEKFQVKNTAHLVRRALEFFVL